MHANSIIGTGNSDSQATSTASSTSANTSRTTTSATAATAASAASAAASAVSAAASAARARRACCTSPEEVFAIANALAVLFASKLTQQQMQTLINLLSLLVAGLSTIVTQQQICHGVEVSQTPVE